MELFEMVRIVYLMRGMIPDINLYVNLLSRILKQQEDFLCDEFLYQLMLNIKYDIIADYEETLHAFYNYDEKDPKDAVPIKRSRIYTKLFNHIRTKMNYLLILLTKIREALQESNEVLEVLYDTKYKDCRNLCEFCISKLQMYRKMTQVPEKAYGTKISSMYYDELEFIDMNDK